LILDTDFLDHWKTRQFIDMIGHEHATHYILRLWFHCQTRRTVTFENMTARQLKAICKFDGDADLLLNAFIESGFVVGYPNSDLGYSEGIRVPKWAEANKGLVANWDNGTKGGRPSKKPQKQPENDNIEPNTKPIDNPIVTHRKPIDNPNTNWGNPSITVRKEEKKGKEESKEEDFSFQSDLRFQDLPKELNDDDFKRVWLEWEVYFRKINDKAFQPMSRGPAWRGILDDFPTVKDAVKAITQAMARGYKQYYKPDKPKQTVTQEPTGGRREDPAYVAEYMAKREQAAKYLAERQAAKAKEAANANAP
jgi:hypothetical protein